MEINYKYSLFEEISDELNIECYAYHVGAFNYNWHEHVECLVVLNGKLEACVEGKIYKMEKDDICFIGSKIGHATLSKDDETVALVLHFSPKILDIFLKSRDVFNWEVETNIIRRNEIFAKKIRKNLIEIVESFSNVGIKNVMRRSIATQEIIYELLINFAKQIKKSEIKKVSDVKDNVIKVLINFLDRSYQERIELKDLSNLVGYHPNYTSELFSRIVGITFTEYLQRKRLSMATKDLKQTDKKISDIALEHGFSNVRAFNNFFKDSFGRTPSEYRQSLDKGTLKIDAEFKKIFLSTDNLIWTKFKNQCLCSKEKEIKEDLIYMEKIENIKNETYEEIIELIKEKINFNQVKNLV